MKHSWENMIDRAEALGCIPYSGEHTIIFKVLHQAECLSYSNMPCGCRPVIFWREIHEPLSEFHIIVDKSNSTRGAI